MRFASTVYGRGAYGRARTVLARPGVDYNAAEVAAIEAAAVGPVEFAPVPGEETPPVAPVVSKPPKQERAPVPVPGTDLVHMGGGWYSLPDGRRIRGLDAAQAELAGVDRDPAPGGGES